MTGRTIVRTASAPIMTVPISQAVAHGSTLYVGGQAGFDPATGVVVEGGFEPQLRQALLNLAAVVEAGGSTLSHALKVTVYVADIDDYAALNRVYGEFFASAPPARKVVQTRLLPGLLAEVDAIVALPEESPAQGEDR